MNVLFALIALVIFSLAAFGVDAKDINLVALGLAFLAAHFIVPTLWSNRPNQ